MNHAIPALRTAAADHDGQLTRGLARGHGVSRAAFANLVRRGDLLAVAPGVWRFAGAAGEPDAEVTAVLACGPDAVLSHASAARRHGLTRVAAPDGPIVTIPHGQRRRNGMDVRHSRRLDPADVLERDGIRMTSLARTVCDLADAEDAWETVALVDDAIAKGAKQGWLHQRASALRPGRPALQLVVEATAPQSAAAFRSALERMAAYVYRAGGLPEPSWNVPVHDDAGPIGIVDALWEPWSVIAETEGLRFHTTPEQRHADAARFNRLAEGHTVRRFGYRDVVDDPVEVVATLHRALRHAGCDLDPARIPRAIAVPGLRLAR